MVIENTDILGNRSQGLRDKWIYVPRTLRRGLSTHGIGFLTNNVVGNTSSIDRPFTLSAVFTGNTKTNLDLSDLQNRPTTSRTERRREKVPADLLYADERVLFDRP